MASESKLTSKLRYFDIRLSKCLRHQLAHPQIAPFTRDHFVIAKHRSTQTWLKARVLSRRLGRGYLATAPKFQDSYDYYVHYQDYDRRNDTWLTLQEIEATNQKITEDEDSEELIDYSHIHPNDNPHFGLSPRELQLHLKLTKFKTIEQVWIGEYLVDAWYYSPYPRYLHHLEVLYVCEYCLSFYGKISQLRRHDQHCPLSMPPGDEIYRDQGMKIAVFEVSGLKNPVFCQNLGLLSKLFLDHKNLLYDLSIFDFYVLCEIQDNAFHIAGYFSRARYSPNNLSCILVFPFYQRKGYGKFLIDFSYQLILIEKKVGTPEKPLSDLGRQAFLNYWTQKTAQLLRADPGKYANLQAISKQTGIAFEDLKWSLECHGLLKVVGSEVVVCTDAALLDEISRQCGSPGARIVTENLRFLPVKKWSEAEEHQVGENQKNESHD